MTKITLEVKDCQGCPNFSQERMYTADSFEIAYNWFCNAKKKKRKIIGYVEWNDPLTPVPDWCPIIVKDKMDK